MQLKIQLRFCHNIFEEEGLLEDGQLAASVMVAFGCGVKDPERPKTRKDMDQAVKWVR